MRRTLLILVFVMCVAFNALGVDTYRFDNEVHNSRGDVIGGAYVYVYPANSDTLAWLYTGPTDAIRKSNPFVTDTMGRLFFYALPGSYDITISGTGITTYTMEDVLLYSPYSTSLSVTELGVEDLRYRHGTYERINYSDPVTSVTRHGVTPINVLDFGVDNTGATDCRDSLSAVVDSVKTWGRCEVYMPPGYYRVDDTWAISDADSMVIAGDCAVFIAGASMTGAMLQVTSSASFSLRGLSFDGNGLAQHGIGFYGCSNIDIYDVDIYDIEQQTSAAGSYAAGIKVSNSAGEGGSGYNIDKCYIHDINGGLTNISRGIIFSTYENNNDVYISDITVSRTFFKEISPVGDGDGIVFAMSDSNGSALDEPINAVVANNKFLDCYKRAVKIQNKGVTVTGNAIHTTRRGTWGGAEWSGFMFTGVSVQAGECVVSDNILTASNGGVYQYGIGSTAAVGTAGNIVISCNTVVNDTVSTGESADPWEQGIGIRVSRDDGDGPTSDVSITGNTIGNTKYGLYVGYDVDDILITGNTVSNAATQALIVYTPTDTISNLIVETNIFDGNLSIGSKLINPLIRVNGHDYLGTGIYDVKAYGAIGDGVNADSSSIQLAIDACEYIGSGSVYFPWTADSYASTGNSTTDADVLLFGPGLPDSIPGGAPRQIYGSGTPEGTIAAPIGSIFQRVDGSSGSAVYLKESGVSDTGWLAICGAKAYVYATLNSATTTTATTAGTYYPIAGTFTNDPMVGFIFDTDHIEYTGVETRDFEIDWHASFSANNATTTVHMGVEVNSVTTAQETMGILCKSAGEEYAMSGTVVAELATDGEIQLVLTTDGDGDVITVNHFTTTIRSVK